MTDPSPPRDPPDGTPRSPTAVTMADVGKRLMRHYRLADLHPDPGNVRADPDPVALGRLVESLRTHGLQQPLIVWEDPVLPAGGARLLDGHRRWKALGLVPLPGADCVVLARPPDPLEVTAIQLTLGVTGQHLNPYEVADAARRLVDGLGLTWDQVARRVGCSPSKLSKARGVSEGAAPALRPEIESGAIPFTVAAALARLGGDFAAQAEVAGRYRQGLLTRDAVEAEVARLARRTGRPRPRPVKGRGRVLSYALATDDHGVAEAELTQLVEAVRKAKRLGLPLGSVPQLMTAARAA
ncbi:MAG: hypothetical protein C0501_26435 [Isosphaera sp.]|nr:hypothetical protein [Isosphaera sp.]